MKKFFEKIKKELSSSNSAGGESSGREGYRKIGTIEKKEDLKDDQNMETILTDPISKPIIPIQNTPTSTSLVINFCCPLCKKVEKGKSAILECIERDLTATFNLNIQDTPSEALQASFKMLTSLNPYSLDKIDPCKQVLYKYISNITCNPDDEKFRKIKKNNKIYLQHVEPITGAIKLLQSVGFVEKTLTTAKSPLGESFFIIEELNDCITSQLFRAMELLKSENVLILTPILDRNVKIISAKSFVQLETDLKDDVFDMTGQEFKKLYEMRHMQIEEMGILKTKHMRDKDKVHLNYTYRYILIRITLPEGRSIQGVFSCSERLLDIFNFIILNLDLYAADNLNFILVLPPSSKSTASSISKEEAEKCEKNLIDLELYPSSVFRLRYNSELFKEIVKSHPALSTSILKQQLLM